MIRKMFTKKIKLEHHTPKAYEEEGSQKGC